MKEADEKEMRRKGRERGCKRSRRDEAKDNKGRDKLEDLWTMSRAKMGITSV